MINKINKLLLLTLVVCIVASCVTTKKKDDEQSFIKQLYHNTTAEYNGYFNADVIMTESVTQLDQQYQDNYNKLLPLYEYVAVDDAKSVSPELDRAIEKVSIVVALHRQSDWTDDCYLLLGKAQYLKKDYESAEETFEFMMDEFNPQAMARNKANAIKKSKSKKNAKQKRAKESQKASKEKSKEREKERDEKQKSTKQSKKERDKERKKYNKEVKKAKKKGKKPPPKPKSKTSKKDTPSAVDAAKEANKKLEEEKAKNDKEKDKEKDKKKKEDAPKPEEEGGLFKKDPAYQEAKLWMARTYIEREKYDFAYGILSQLENDPNTYDEVKRELAHVKAYYHLEQKEYSKAIPSLENAIELGKDRQAKARYSYILAQLYQMENKTDKAFAYFNKAMKYSNNYEMEFSARLSMAQNSYQTGQTTPEQTIKALERMLKDDKNIEYKDQIYYALANVALDNNQRKEAIAYLESSLSHNTRNKAQRSESYLKLAELYFEEESYVDAKLYYDSTLTVLATTDERYDKIVNYRESLIGIAENLQVIALQDSLLAISAMSDREKRKLAAKIKEEKAKQTSSLSAQSKAFDKTGRGRASSAASQPGRSSTRGGIASDTGTSFPLYDERILKKGRKDFSKRWGERQLEDNWRRSSKQGISNIANSEEEEEEENLEIRDEEIALILKDVPQTPEQKEKAEKAIEDAMIELGRLYRERLEKNDKTVDVLEDGLLERFPETTHELDAWYYLHLAHKELNNRSQAQFYFDKIVEKYPETTYARVLTDPSFLANSQAEKQRLSDYYDATFIDYQSGKFKSAFDRIEKAKSMFGASNPLQAKFALLAALCTGNIKGKEEYAKSLKEVIAKFPETEEQKRAKEILRLLDGKALESAGGAAAALANSEAGKKFSAENDKLHYMIITITDKGDVKVNDAKSALANYNRKFYNLDKLRVSNIYLGSDTSRPIMVVRKFKNKERAMEYYDGAQKAGNEFLPDGLTFDMYPVTQNNYRLILKEKSMAGYDAFFRETYLK